MDVAGGMDGVNAAGLAVTLLADHDHRWLKGKRRPRSR